MARTSNWTGAERIDLGRLGDYPLYELAKSPPRPLAEHTANHVAELDDLGRYNHMVADVSNTFSIPEDATTDFPDGALLAIVQAGAGATTVDGETGGVTLVSFNSSGGARVMAGQWATAYARKIGPNTWHLSGEFL